MCNDNKECGCGCEKKQRLYIKDRATIVDKKIGDDGILVVDAILCRTGVQDYRAWEIGLDGGDKLIRVYRSPEEVFKQESIDSFAGVPVTNEHPPVLLNDGNRAQYSVGTVDKRIERVDNILQSKLFISDPHVIRLINDGKTEISNGYMAFYDLESGTTPDGEEYDAVQREIVGNHVAIVNQGRCGTECRIILDNKITTGDTPKMKKKFIQVNDETFEVSEDAEDIVEALKKEIELLKAALAQKDNEMKKMSDEMQAQKDNSEYKEKNLDGEIEELAEKRLGVTDVARRVIPAFDCKGKKISDIKRAVVSEKRKNISLDGKSDEYINAMFDFIQSESESSSSELSRFVGDSMGGLNLNGYKSPREEMIEFNRNLGVK